MSDKKLYLIAEFDYITQKTLAGYYDSLSQCGFVGSQTKDISYHITLGSADVEHEEELANAIDRICAETACIDINLAYIGVFGLHVLFIAPNMNFELLKLQNSFFSQNGNGYHNWAAHVTLLMDEPQAILRALPIAAGNFKPFQARIESIALYEFFPERFIKERGLIRA